MADKLKLTRSETRALWAAVEWMALCLRQTGAGTPEQIEAEKERLNLARLALRKVNAIRKSQSPRRMVSIPSQEVSP